MSRRAWLYLYFVFLVSLVWAGFALTWPIRSVLVWPAFIVLTVLATLAQLFKALFKSDQKSEHGTTTYTPKLIVFFAGIYLLPPPLLVMLFIIPHLVDWVKEHLTKSANLPKWYIQPFNIATHLLAGLVAQWIWLTAAGEAAPLDTLGAVAVVLAGALAFVFVNHLLVGIVMYLARGVSLRESGVFELDNLTNDLIQLCLGYVVAIVWRLNPVLIVPALAPLVMIYRALTVPQLKKDAQTDPKTGLANAGYFAQVLKAEFERAGNLGQPVSVIMADLDLLRNVNNTYGHLAGDTVLIGIARVIRETVRDSGTAGRFGGEEFSVILPRMNEAQAQTMAERIRQAVAEIEFKVGTSPQPIHVTLSLGVAAYSADVPSPKELIHEADVAVYQAKLRGRNRVVCASDVPRSVKLESAATDARLDSPYAGDFTPKPTVAEASQPDAALSTTPPLAQAEATAAPPTTSSRSDAPAQTAGSRWTWAYVGCVIAAGIVTAVWGLALDRPLDYLVILLFAVLAGFAEFFQMDLYGDGSISVSVAFSFAVALIAGIPGMILTSAAITYAHYLRRRHPWYKSAFNWSIHLLAALAPVLIIRAQGVPLQVSNVFLLSAYAGIAALIYFVIETGLIAVAIGLSDNRSSFTTWRDQYRWLAPYYLILCLMGTFLALAYLALGMLGVLVFTVPVLMMRFAQKQYIDRTKESTGELKRMNQELTQANREIADASRAMRQLNDELFLTLSKIIDARDPHVAGHAAKVSDYAVAIATDLGVKGERLEYIRQAALLHDIGKLGISEQILHKPARLTDNEYTYVKTHTTLGGEFLETCRGLRHLAPFIRHHHEWWDGTGYPDRWQGEQIPLEARILAVCDAVEAMASDRPYHRGLSLGEIIAEVKRCAGTQFDPAVVNTFVRAVERSGQGFVVNSAEELARHQTSPQTSQDLGTERFVPERVAQALGT
jgi:diguanylate cyclase (GGDEF)-like protein/putative nucleotidyltransferase with HDIG domain